MRRNRCRDDGNLTVADAFHQKMAQRSNDTKGIEADWMTHRTTGTMSCQNVVQNNTHEDLFFVEERQRSGQNLLNAFGNTKPTVIHDSDILVLELVVELLYGVGEYFALVLEILGENK